MKKSSLIVFIFLLLSCTTNPVKTICSVEGYQPIYFNPKFTKEDLPIQIVNNLNISKDKWELALNYWQDLSPIQLFQEVADENQLDKNKFFVVFKTQDTFEGIFPDGSNPTAGTTVQDTECIIIDNLSHTFDDFEDAFPHELGHCLGFGHSSGVCGCVMFGTLPDGLKVDCSLDQLTDYLN